MTGPSAELLAAARDNIIDLGEEVDAARKLLKKQRDFHCEIADLEERTKDLKAKLATLERIDLPAAFEKAKIDSLGLPAEGNLPAYDAKLKPYYKANIAASWEDEKKAKAFSYLKHSGNGHLVRTKIGLNFGLGELTKVNKLRQVLRRNGFGDFSEAIDVPWTSLTKFVKDHFEEKGTCPGGSPAVLGVDAGYVVELKQRK